VPQCKGFEVKIQGPVKNKEGAVIGVTEHWEINDVSGAKIQCLRHRAVGCSMICNERESKCRNCENIRSHCHRRLNNVECSSDEKQVKKKRLSYMSQEELTSRLQAEQTRAKNAERKAERAKDRKKEIEEEMEQFTEDDHNDFKDMFERLEGNNIPEEMRMFWEAQKEVLEKTDARGNRWHSKIISLCLSVWTRSPDAYKQLQESGMFKLPSGRLLSLYKNSVRQSAGLNDDVLDWLLKEADKSNLDEFGREGGLILDEMSIQEDLQIKSENGVKRLVGLVDLGKEHNSMKALSTGTMKMRNLPPKCIL
ncbi:uncharacterized protein LOC110249721, partial [Exaiptasia diaphana]|uniref:Transposable element P transposase-like RNase H domain-containing protein n=1 Tax=Exaiptasia diaphana TaxID=2652724 RepID=A0A913XXS0_EXADI